MPGGAHPPEELLEQVAALKHDLGKYVAWTSANLDDGVWEGPVEDELVSALRADLLQTRKHGERCEAAWEVWRAHRAGLPEALEPELAAVERAVASLERAGRALAEDDRQALAEQRGVIRAAQQDIRLQLRSLHRRLLRER
ncbi:hypothetical protein G6O69_32295 [Pseudenhygromyxa sp. WMMC2535]|uniref:hypothetical protein n=1 Tax=Pseudenhygromyxa sp. WMMC2535 TaxID=2712867 RepID=UPI00155584D5|nr:hypothetical protein [Pseudenhygromyxa sp. WMMC2535]NVB42549.1 hypothetical protein [Pseudenhygromyxa sp. WMMC2535]